MSETEPDISLDDTASKINLFKKARDAEQAEFDVYVYRIVTDSNKKQRNPFLTKYSNYLPDEQEIAEKFRGGRYKLQAIWYVNGKQKSESWSYEIDESAFPVQSSLSKLTPPSSGGDFTQNMMFMVADIVKAAYTTRAPVENDFTRRDPLEMFGEVQAKMQEMYTRMIDIQAGVMERSFQAKLENKFGLGTTDDNQFDDEGESAGIMESGVIEIVKQIVDAAKLILPMLGLPGAKPIVEGIKKNPAFSKYAELAKDPVIVREVAAALRNEYGDVKAGLLLNSFGIKMVQRPGVPAAVPGKPVPVKAKVTQSKSPVKPANSSKKQVANVKKG